MNQRTPTVLPVTLTELPPRAPLAQPRPVDLLDEVGVVVSVIAGRTTMTLREVRGLRPGSVVTLDRSPDATVDILVNGRHTARGDVIVLDDTLATRVSDIDPLPDRA